MTDARMGLYTVEHRCRTLLRAYAREIGMEVDTLLERSRKQPLVQARQGFMFAAREAGFSQPVTGRVLGLDHTTVCEGLKSIDARIALTKPTCPCCGRPMERTEDD